MPPARPNRRPGFRRTVASLALAGAAFASAEALHQARLGQHRREVRAVTNAVIEARRAKLTRLGRDVLKGWGQGRTKAADYPNLPAPVAEAFLGEYERIRKELEKAAPEVTKWMNERGWPGEYELIPAFESNFESIRLELVAKQELPRNPTDIELAEMGAFSEQYSPRIREAVDERNRKITHYLDGVMEKGFEAQGLKPPSRWGLHGVVALILGATGLVGLFRRRRERSMRLDEQRRQQRAQELLKDVPPPPPPRGGPKK